MRDRPKNLLDVMRVRGGITVDELAGELQLTRTSVVNHLKLLMGEGLVKRGGLRPGSRRPSVIYTLTANADRIFPQLYEEFLTDILEELSSHRPANVKRIIAGVRKRWLTRDLSAVEGLRGEQRVRRALDVLSKRGFMPVLEGPPETRELKQYNCPLRRLCAGYPDVRDMITQWIRALFGVPLIRLGCSATGDTSCSYILGREVRPSKPIAKRGKRYSR